MAKQRDAIAMTEAEQAEYLAKGWTLQVASNGVGGFPHLVAMYYAIIDGKVHFHTYPTSQKIVNLKRDSKITVMLESGEAYNDLKGMVIRGTAEVIADPEVTGQVLLATSKKYFGTPAEVTEVPDAMKPQAHKRVTVRVTPESVYSWDHAKMGQGR